MYLNLKHLLYLLNFTFKMMVGMRCRDQQSRLVHALFGIASCEMSNVNGLLDESSLLQSSFAFNEDYER